MGNTSPGQCTYLQYTNMQYTSKIYIQIVFPNLVAQNLSFGQKVRCDFTADRELLEKTLAYLRVDRLHILVDCKCLRMER